LAVSAMDFSRPIMDNRMEYIAIKFSGCLKNACEEMYVSMMYSDYGKWVEKYPGIEIVKNSKDVKEAYYQLMYYTPERFLVQMRQPKPPLPRREIMGDISHLLGYMAKPQYCSMTTLELAIREVANYDFCKAIYIYDTALSEDTKQYLATFFRGVDNKVFMYTGFFKELVAHHPEITTYFIDNVEDLMETMEYYEGIKEPETLSEKQFFVQGLASIEKADEKSGEIHYKYENYMKDAIPRFNANVMWIVSHYIDLHSNAPTFGMEDINMDKKESNSGQDK
jgi:hypothetical protein